MKRRSIWLIVVSLLVASLMIASGWFIADKGTGNLVSNLLIAAWWIPFTLFAGQSRCCGNRSASS